jgi:hypothetical protein
VYHILIGTRSPCSRRRSAADDVCEAHGIDPLTLGMIWTFRAGRLFIYESRAVVGYSYGSVDNQDAGGRGAVGRHGAHPAAALPFYWPLIGLGDDADHAPCDDPSWGWLQSRHDWVRAAGGAARLPRKGSGQLAQGTIAAARRRGEQVVQHVQGPRA